MKLNKTWKIIIGILTAIITIMPIFFVIGMMFFMMTAIGFSDGYRSEPSPFFMFLFFIGFFGQFIWIFLRLGMIAFYQVHVVLNEEGSKLYRILLSLGNFFIPFISMPAYYFIYIYPESPPAWAFENPPVSIEDTEEKKPKPKAKKKPAKKKTGKKTE